ncbi:DUF6252 family protein [Mucilaginibacter jinjuensis]|uniref:DUF6252 family protein n=1 Tax=Mucilaginibacter jinjuensis TaxID=1176721 RepID=A0ABY7T9E8_9SPHI|nr:DUF6252 family protein [Mucilaginibacter jinjuensis]WCT12889.1 DUF6252 family protein [Mucilaginibacter jinjuensis]
MKNLTVSLLALFAVLMFSCKKDKQADTPNIYYIKASKNGVSWSTKSYSIFNAQKTKPDTIVVGGSLGEEHISILAKLNSQGNYIPDPAKTTFYTTIGQDVIMSTYTLDTTKDNTISVTKPSSSEIQGTFTLTFKKTGVADSNPATVTFNQGEFKSALSIAL